MSRIIKVFILANFLLIAAITVLWMVPAVNSLRDGMVVVRAQESRYVIEGRFLAEYESNLLELESATQEQRLLRYDEFAQVLAEIGRLAEGFGLRRLEFNATEPVGSDLLTARFQRLFETRVRAVYEGALYGVLGFVYDLDKAFGSVLSLTVVSQGNYARLDVEFVLFGSE